MLKKDLVLGMIGMHRYDCPRWLGGGGGGGGQGH